MGKYKALGFLFFALLVLAGCGSSPGSKPPQDGGGTDNETTITIVSGSSAQIAWRPKGGAWTETELTQAGTFTFDVTGTYEVAVRCGNDARLVVAVTPEELSELKVCGAGNQDHTVNVALTVDASPFPSITRAEIYRAWHYYPTECTLDPNTHQCTVVAPVLPDQAKFFAVLRDGNGQAVAVKALELGTLTGDTSATIAFQDANDGVPSTSSTPLPSFSYPTGWSAYWKVNVNFYNAAPLLAKLPLGGDLHYPVIPEDYPYFFRAIAVEFDDQNKPVNALIHVEVQRKNDPPAFVELPQLTTIKIENTPVRIANLPRSSSYVLYDFTLTMPDPQSPLTTFLAVSAGFLGSDASYPIPTLDWATGLSSKTAPPGFRISYVANLYSSNLAPRKFAKWYFNASATTLLPGDWVDAVMNYGSVTF